MDKTWLDYLIAIGTLATPVLVLLLMAVGWRLRSRLERVVRLEEKLREDRIAVYNEILEPFIILLTSDEAFARDKKYKGVDKSQLGAAKMLSVDYRRNAFKMALMGSDSVVRAYNDLMQFFFTHGSAPLGPEETKQAAALLGHFLLEIRRSMGNEATKLDNWEMLEWFITDARKHRGA